MSGCVDAGNGPGVAGVLETMARIGWGWEWLVQG